MMTRDLSMIRKSCAALALALAAGACGESTAPDSFAAALNYDVAMVDADATLQDVDLWSQPLSFGPAPAPGPAGADVTWSGSHDVTFYDADGNEQEAYDELTTDAIHILHEMDAQVTRDSWTATIHRERDKTVSGLEGAETQRTWNGTGSEEIHRDGITLDGQERSYDAVGTFTYDDVVVPIPGSVPRYPISGTITRTHTVTVTGPNGTRTHTVEAVITFDGTSTATMVVNGVTRQIDLTAHDGFPFRRR